MSIYPDYYKKFRCIAGNCLHSCCIGWQICIDDETFAGYMNSSDAFSQRLKMNIETDEQCFVLGENERCPFLNDDNLCDIIINKGENWLCEICAQHPRFRNYIGENEQIGLGLCCEEVARIILNKSGKTLFEGEPIAENETEKAYFKLQNIIIEILQNRELSLSKRFEKLEDMFGAGLPHRNVNDIALEMKGLQRLEKDWEKYIEKIPQGNPAVMDDEKWCVPFEQLAVYFIYRHLPGGLEDGRYVERIAFAGFSVYAIAMMFGGEDMAELEEISRRFSAEVEYCEENVETLLEILGN